MLRTLRLLLATLLALTCLNATQLRAETRPARGHLIHQSPSDQPIDLPADELTELRERIASLEDMMLASPVSDSELMADDAVYYDSCDAWWQVVAGAEVPLLKPSNSMGVRGVDNTDLPFDLKASARSWLGVTTSGGLGLRVRYWVYDHDESGPSVVNGRTDSIDFDTYTLDFEITDTACLGSHWQTELSWGLRYVEYDETAISRNAAGAIAAAHELDFSGLGGTAGLTVYQQLPMPVGLFASFRGSVLVGDEQEYTGANFTLVDEEFDDMKYIFELKCGAELNRCLASGSLLYVSCAYELQYWSGFSAEPLFDGGEAAGFSGFTIGAGLRR